MSNEASGKMEPSNPEPGNPERGGSAVHLWLVLWKAARALEAYARQNIERLGICQSDFAVLEALLHKGPLTVNVLGTKVLLTSGSITTAVDRLKRRGLVERRADSKDRRARIVHLTARGRKLIRELFARHERAIERAVSILTQGERRVVTGLLRRLGQGANELLPDRANRAAGQAARRRTL
jgi:MarR family transcriptional regulator, 2-MHQ and catechol-resistance regulon repressor